jgi:hypothetical protein
MNKYEPSFIVCDVKRGVATDRLVRNATVTSECRNPVKSVLSGPVAQARRRVEEPCNSVLPNDVCDGGDGLTSRGSWPHLCVGGIYGLGKPHHACYSAWKSSDIEEIPASSCPGESGDQWIQGSWGGGA